MTDTPMTADEVRKIIFAFTSVDAGEIHTPHGSIDLRDMCKRLASLADLLERKAPDYLRLIIDGVICDAVERGHSTGSDTDRILALIQPAVKVKPLRWHDRPSESVSHHSSGLFEEYKIDWHGPDEFYLSYRHVGFDTTFLTLEAAKAAAQRHYDNAIREALEPVSDGMVMVSREPTDTQLDRALHSLGSPNPKESKVWLRAFYRAMLSAAPTGGE